MKTKFFKVVSQGVVSYIPSSKEASGQLAKCVIRLKEFGGGKYGDEYSCTLFGNLALCKFYKGDLLVASLRFQVHDVNGNSYQEVVATDVVKINQG